MNDTTGFEKPSEEFIEHFEVEQQPPPQDTAAGVDAAEGEDFDWLGGEADRRADQDQMAAASFKDQPSESISSAFRKAIPQPIQLTFFVLVGLLLAVPSLLGVLGSPLPKYFHVSLHVYTMSGLSIVYLPGAIFLVLRQVSKLFRRSLTWSKTELPAYIDSIRIPLSVAVCGSILYALWAYELPQCEPDRLCYWRYIHRIYYVMLGASFAFAVEVAFMRQWCNNYRRQTYQGRIIDNRFRCYIVEQLKVAAKQRRLDAQHGAHTAPGRDPQDHESDPAEPERQGLLASVQRAANTLAGYAPIPLPVTRIAKIRDFSWFQRHLNSMVLMEHYQKIGEQKSVSDYDAKRLAKNIFETLCPPDRDYLIKDDFAAIVPGDALDDSYYTFDHDRDGEITKLEFRNTIVDIFAEQRHLSKAIADADMAISKLNAIVVTTMWLGVFFVMLLALDVAVQNMLTLSLSTILGVNVIIGDVVRSILASIMFVFVNHPYDVGDLVVVGKPDEQETLTVQHINLLTTVFRRWNCQELYFANHILVSMPVTNLARSPEQWERIDFHLPSHVNEEQLDEVREQLGDFFRENNVDFFGNFELRAVVAADAGKGESDLEKIRFSLRVKCKPTNDPQKQWNRHSRVIRLVKQMTSEIK